jgi:hypothetical protein
MALPPHATATETTAGVHDGHATADRSLANSPAGPTTRRHRPLRSVSTQTRFGKGPKGATCPFVGQGPAAHASQGGALTGQSTRTGHSAVSQTASKLKLIDLTDRSGKITFGRYASRHDRSSLCGSRTGVQRALITGLAPAASRRRGRRGAGRRSASRKWTCLQPRRDRPGADRGPQRGRLSVSQKRSILRTGSQSPPP